MRMVLCFALALVGGCSGGNDDAGGNGNGNGNGDSMSDAGVPPTGDASVPSDGDSTTTPPGDGASGGHYVSGTFTNAQGQRDWQAWIPSGYHDGTPVPLVMVLHGCSQQIADIEATSQYTQLAEARTFIVVYPQQSSSANPLLCWNWFSSADQARDQGEPSIIAGIAQDLAGKFTVDEKRIYVIGASAGAAMSVILGATYPDVFAAIGVIAGCEYQGAPCGSSGGPDPSMQGQLAYQAMGARARVVPTLVFQGDADSVVPPVNGQQVTAQWVDTDDWADDGMHNGSLPSTATSTTSGQVPDGGRSYDVSDYAASGSTVVESYVVHGAGHAWPGGPASAAFTDPTGPDATTLSYQFFLAHPAP